MILNFSLNFMIKKVIKFKCQLPLKWYLYYNKNVNSIQVHIVYTFDSILLGIICWYIFGVFGRFLCILEQCAPPDQCVTKHEKSIYPELGSSSKFLHDSSVTAIICKIQHSTYNLRLIKIMQSLSSELVLIFTLCSD